MVSTRSALKRPNGDNESSIKPSKRARTASQPPPARSLIDLPSEVRRMILSELLWYEHPLEFNPAVDYYTFNPPANRKLHPRILQTCKQLYMEGSEILYNNTINCRVGEPFYRPQQGRFGNFILDSEYCGFTLRLPPAIVQRISRVRVQLFAHHQHDKRELSRDCMERGLEELALEFRKAPAWKHINIEVIHVYFMGDWRRQSRDPSDSISFASALHPLRYVRNRSAVTISGLSSRLISALPALMTSTAPFVDLALAFKTLKDYSRIVIAPIAQDRIRSPHLDTIFSQTTLCAKAVRREDIDLFIRSRKRLMAVLNGIVMRQEAKVFEHDPSRWDTGPDLTTTAPDGGSEVPPVEDHEPLSDYDAYDVFDDAETEAYDDSAEEDSDDSEEDDWDSDGDPWGNGGGCECPHCRDDDSP